MYEIPIKVVMSDVDGTLISKGDLVAGYPQRLGELVREARQRKVGFSLASGRDYYAQDELWMRMTKDERGLQPYEAISSEDSQLVLGTGAQYTFGGLGQRTLEVIEQIEREYPEAFEGMVVLPGSKARVRTGRVTREFAAGEGTNKDRLERAYGEIKSLFERLRCNPLYASDISQVHIGKSADAVDMVDGTSSKAKPFGKYLEILQEMYYIYPEEVLVLGDAANDELMLKKVLEEGGVAGYVGKPEQIAISGERLEEVLRAFAEGKRGKLIIPSVRGPEGTVEILESVLRI